MSLDVVAALVSVAVVDDHHLSIIILPIVHGQYHAPILIPDLVHQRRLHRVVLRLVVASELLVQAWLQIALQRFCRFCLDT